MGMGVAVGTSIVLMAVSILVHYAAMRVTLRWLAGHDFGRHWGVLVGMGIVMAAQVLTICLYALVYEQIQAMPQMGQLEGEIEGGWLDYFYFSIMSYTTLGVGDIHPTGALRVISGLQALNGFALIGWTASFAYALMREGWK